MGMIGRRHWNTGRGLGGFLVEWALCCTFLLGDNTKQGAWAWMIALGGDWNTKRGGNTKQGAWAWIKGLGGDWNTKRMPNAFLTLLSVFGRRHWNTGRGLGGFLVEWASWCTFLLGDNTKQGAWAWMIALGGDWNTKRGGTIKRDLGLRDADLALLCRERLLREEPRGNSYYYEISHDTLLAPILRARDVRLAAEERAQNVRRIRRLSAIVLLLMVGVVGAVWLAVWALGQRDKAVTARRETEQEKIKAEQALASLQREQAAKMLLEFEEKEKRARTILDGGGCPEDIFREMQNIARTHSDSLTLKSRLHLLYSKNPNCKMSGSKYE